MLSFISWESFFLSGVVADAEPFLVSGHRYVPVSRDLFSFFPHFPALADDVFQDTALCFCGGWKE